MKDTCQTKSLDLWQEYSENHNHRFYTEINKPLAFSGSNKKLKTKILTNVLGVIL